ncbi:MAG: bifunctional shikimate kinase/3-dehydroquinate synthase [Deltaproteobacteria bacterium]|nr:bifunctional shikimate kinase/3-dehydroquinate synthase [Deltaproteobacteria bacterium]
MKDHTLFTPYSRGQAPDRAYPEKNIFLTGFMGAGKTTVGRLLAQALNRPFVDMDAELVKLHNKSIPRIFSELGEAHFRQAEATLLKNLNEQDQPKVIATGGGIVQSEANCEILTGALTFFLNISAEEAWKRLSEDDKDDRPLASSFRDFKSLLAKRQGLYQKCGAAFSAAAGPKEISEAILDFVLWQEPVILGAEGRSSRVRTYAPVSLMAELKKELLASNKAMVLMDHHFRDTPDEFNRLFADLPVYYAKGAGEAAKTFGEVGDLLLAMSEAGLDRSDYLVVRGGGSLTDLGALAAGLFKRGLKLILVPTTVLAAVDASIGAKAAVNLAGAKNQVGLFYLPEEVWIDPLVLRSVPDNLKRDGLIEAYKTALLFDPLLAELISRQLTNLLSGDLLILSQIVHDAARLKIELVAKDLREELGLRDVLNLGHTYGHAVESYHAPNVSHGRAVALGLAVALVHSVKRHGFDETAAKNAIHICRLLAGGAFPSPPPEKEVLRLLSFDKKIRQGRLKFVALKAPGEAVLETNLNPPDLLDAAKELFKNQTPS